MYKVVCIGTGRLAYNLMPQLEKAGCRVIELYNRTPEHATALAKRLPHARLIHDLTSITAEGDLYVFTLRDDAIAQVSASLVSLEDGKKIFVHCSGVSAIDILPFQRKGSFYPLQTFSYTHEIDWTTTPILITATIPEIQRQLVELAHRMSQVVQEVTDEQKAYLHLAAVFANNFTNHMLTLAEHICIGKVVPFSLLKPLIEETIHKAMDIGPEPGQTGPAIRRDRQTIEKHLHLLKTQPELAEVYRLITASIQRR